MAFTSNRQSGLGLVELFLGSTAMMTVVLCIVGGLMTSLKVAIDTNDEKTARDLAIRVVRSFRADCEGNLALATRAYHGKVVEEQRRRVFVRVILDETRYDPPADLNGDGDCDDRDLDPARVTAAYVETKVLWGQNNAKTFVTLVRCPDERPLASPAARDLSAPGK